MVDSLAIKLRECCQATLLRGGLGEGVLIGESQRETRRDRVLTAPRSRRQIYASWLW